MPNGVGLLSALFPHDPSYEGLLSIERINDLKRASLAQAGLGIMGASMPGPNAQPLGQAIAGNLGNAIGQFPQMLEGAAVSAGRIASFNREQEVLRARREIIANNPRQAGESEIDWLRRLYPFYLQSGDTEVLTRLTELLKSAGAANPQLKEGVLPPGVPGAGEPRMFRVGPNGTAQPVEGMRPEPNADRSIAQQALNDQRRFQRENQLNDDYNRTVQPWLVPFSALKRAAQYKDAALQGNGPAQIQLLYAFINTLDNSVVREGEVGLLSRAAPVLDRAKQAYAKIAQGKAAAIPPEMLSEMATIVDDLQGRFADRFTAWRNHYTKRALRWGVDPNSFIDIPEVFSAGAKKPLSEY
jgi:hypothetical protein